MITESVMLQTLCVPCASRCRYCLLSWDGETVGAPWEQSMRFAESFSEALKAQRPDVRFDFTFGCSMEHPQLSEALRFLKRIGSPQATYLQCDGMRMRDARACAKLMQTLRAEGVESLNFTVYGLQEYHDAFAHRSGDFALVMRMLKAAQAAGLQTSVGIPLTAENASTIDALVPFIRTETGCHQLHLFIPHEEGRGVLLHKVRLTERELNRLSPDVRKLLNRNVFRTEREWIAGGYREETKRSLLVSLRRDNFERYASMTAADVVSEIEALDDSYYAAFPSFFELAERYGDPNGDGMYRQRDLFYHYRRMFKEEFHISVYDVTDERQSGSRRY